MPSYLWNYIAMLKEEWLKEWQYYDCVHTSHKKLMSTNTILLVLSPIGCRLHGASGTTLFCLLETRFVFEMWTWGRRTAGFCALLVSISHFHDLWYIHSWIFNLLAIGEDGSLQDINANNDRKLRPRVLTWEWDLFWIIDHTSAESEYKWITMMCYTDTTIAVLPLMWIIPSECLHRDLSRK